MVRVQVLLVRTAGRFLLLAGRRSDKDSGVGPMKLPVFTIVHLYNFVQLMGTGSQNSLVFWNDEDERGDKLFVR